MKRFITSLPVAVLFAACGPSEPAVLVGAVESSSQHALTAVDAQKESSDPAQQLAVEINGQESEIQLADDGSFAVPEFPTGQVTFSVRGEGITGTITLEDVRPGEVVDISVRTSGDTFEIRVVQRTPPEDADDDLLHVTGNVFIAKNRAVLHLADRVYEGDITIKGNKVTLIGSRSGQCWNPNGTVVAGRLTIEGNNVRLIDLDIQGDLDIRGNNARVYSSCGSEPRLSDLREP